jgi:hypothetical protein
LAHKDTNHPAHPTIISVISELQSLHSIPPIPKSFVAREFLFAEEIGSGV